jgi:acetolactate synthase-1/2/3 large subunit
LMGVDTGQFDERRQRWAHEHARLEDVLRAAMEISHQRDEIDAVAVCSTLNELLPDGATFVDETVTHSPTIIQHLRWTKPQSFLRVTNGLGQGMGVAIGAKLAAPEKTIVLLVGDGSFLYNPIVQALGASQSGALPILIVVFNNRKYASMQSGHLHHYPQSVARATERFHGVDILGPDYAELGRPFGFHGARVQTRADLMPAFLESLAAVASGRTSILNVALEA